MYIFFFNYNYYNPVKWLENRSGWAERVWTFLEETKKSLFKKNFFLLN